jgi:hypothetical protein
MCLILRMCLQSEGFTCVHVPAFVVPYYQV